MSHCWARFIGVRYPTGGGPVTVGDAAEIVPGTRPGCLAASVFGELHATVRSCGEVVQLSDCTLGFDVHKWRRVRRRLHGGEAVGI